MENNLVEIKEQSVGLDTFGSISGFEAAQRMAVALSNSTIVPTSYQGAKNVGNCIIALDIADRLHLSPIMVMQNLYVVHGKPSWGGSSVAALINSSGKFLEPIEYVMEGVGDGASCYCTATTKQGKILKGTTISIKMAKAEGWYSKAGSKWQTMPEQMLQYRAASYFGRIHCSDVLMGIYSEEEVKELEPMTVSIDQFKEEMQQEVEELANAEFIDIPEKEVQVVQEETEEAEF